MFNLSSERKSHAKHSEKRLLYWRGFPYRWKCSFSCSSNSLGNRFICFSPFIPSIDEVVLVTWAQPPCRHSPPIKAGLECWKAFSRSQADQYCAVSTYSIQRVLATARWYISSLRKEYKHEYTHFSRSKIDERNEVVVETVRLQSSVRSYCESQYSSTITLLYSVHNPI